MIEIIARVVGHAQFVHDALRTHVGKRGEGHNLLQSDSVEAIPQSCGRAFGGQPTAPMFWSKPPTDLDRRREWSFKADVFQSDVTGKFVGRAPFKRPRCETVLSEMADKAVDHGITFVARQRGREELHHARICVDAGKGLAIRLAPAAKKQSFRDKLSHAAMITAARSLSIASSSHFTCLAASLDLLALSSTRNLSRRSASRIERVRV